jgi:hypothetical protein
MNIWKKLLFTSLALGAIFTISNGAHADTGYGQTLENAERGEGFTAGDMTVRRSGQNSTVGNGVDESVSWTFDFSADQALLDAFLADDSELTSAELIFLDIKVTNARITTDWVGIPGIGGQRFGLGSAVAPTDSALVRLPAVSGVPEVNQSGSFSFDLLSHGVDAETIMKVLLSDVDHTNPWYNEDDWAGSQSDYTIANDVYAIPFIYMDDAIIRDVQLVLTKGNSQISARSTAVPEPAVIGSLLLIGSSLLVVKRQRRLSEA